MDYIEQRIQAIEWELGNPAYDQAIAAADEHARVAERAAVATQISGMVGLASGVSVGGGVAASVVVAGPNIAFDNHVAHIEGFGGAIGLVATLAWLALRKSARNHTRAAWLSLHTPPTGFNGRKQ